MTPAGPAAEFDLLVRNGMLVIPGVGEVKADIAVADGRIVALGENLAGSAKSTFDAGGKVVLPGLFRSAHAHWKRALVRGGSRNRNPRGRARRRDHDRHLHPPSRGLLPGADALRCGGPWTSAATSTRSFIRRFSTGNSSPSCRASPQEHGIRSYKFYMSGIPGIVERP